MKSKRTLEDLTPAQQEQLTALLAALNTFPVPETIVRCQEAIDLGPNTEFDPVQVDAAAAGAWAHDRMLLYLERLRSLNEERMQIGECIHQLLEHPEQSSKAEAPAAVWAKVMASHLAGEQEIVLNFFCISIQHIRSLLMVTSDAVHWGIPQDDLGFLDEFRFLRNHFEHWYDRLPGKTNEAGLITRMKTADGDQIRGGLQTDENDRIIVIEPKKSGPVTHVVDVTNDGLARVEKIVQEASAKVKQLALDRVRTHYIEHPQTIPSPKSLKQHLLIDVGRRANTDRRSEENE